MASYIGQSIRGAWKFYFLNGLFQFFVDGMVGWGVYIMRRFRLIVCSAACTVLVLSDNAYAYIDPGTGSYILQIVIAGLVGAAFTLKLFWKRIQIFFSRGASKKGGEEDPSGEDG